MAFKTLKITFGGLCMFVQNDTDPTGLFVLLPTHNPGDAEMVHCQMLLTDAANSGGQGRLLPIKGKEFNLTNLAAPGPRAPKPLAVLEVSHYLKRVVDPQYFTAKPDGTGRLGARIVLPLGTPMTLPKDTTEGKLGSLIVPGASDAAFFTGQLEVVVDVDQQNPPIPVPDLANVPLVPDGNGEVRVTIVNIPRAHLDLKKRPHMKGQAATHIRAYYKLLQDFDVFGQAWPDVLVGETTPGDVNPDPPAPCPDTPEKFMRLVKFIDPLNCTVSIGCSPDTPGC